MKKKIICFDIDNIICKTIKNDYSKSKPKRKIIKLINELYDKGYIIKIHTARYMGRTNDNIIKANKIGYKKTYSQLKSWGVKFNKLFLSKPSFDVYVDDKNLYHKSNWVKDLKSKLLKN
tara:strand:- start:69 stop:425 length:357 start_codon:yes stop_codon:yes gene_type:complete